MSSSETILTATLFSISLTVVCLFGYLSIAFLAIDPLNFSSLSSSLTNSAIVPDGPIVHTSSGKVEGYFHEVLGQRINVFLGIPYATPPIGSFRFSRPEPVIRWKGTLKAKSQPPACMQFNSQNIDLPWIRPDDPVPESEDCLKLNIWTPYLSQSNKSLPVMIWIHGGGFVAGHVRMPEFDAAIFSAFGNVVVAMMNYRVGLFGFLDLNDDDISGNMGLFDQVLAIEWIKKNARSFGGDPDSITLWGESAGAASVGFHMLSPLSNHLFKRAILQSGSPLMPISLVSRDQVEETARQVLQFTGCNTSVRDDMAASCLRSLPVKRLLEAQSRIIRRKDDTTFSPTFNDDFLPENPMDSMRNGSFGSQKQVLLGFNKDEGSIFLYFANPKKYLALRGSKSRPKVNVSMQEVQDFATNFLKSQNPIATKNLLNSLYMDVQKKAGSVFNATKTHVGEFLIICPVIFAADDFAARNLSVYFYHFTQRPSNTVWADWVGSTHYDEVQFVFGRPLLHPDAYTKEEVKLSKRMMSAWASFARTGSPQISSLHAWPKYLSERQAFVELNARSSRIKNRNIPQEKCNLWKLTFEFSHSQSATLSSRIEGVTPSPAAGISNSSDKYDARETDNAEENDSETDET